MNKFLLASLVLVALALPTCANGYGAMSLNYYPQPILLAPPQPVYYVQPPQSFYAQPVYTIQSQAYYVPQPVLQIREVRDIRRVQEVRVENVRVERFRDRPQRITQRTVTRIR